MYESWKRTAVTPSSPLQDAVSAGPGWQMVSVPFASLAWNQYQAGLPAVNPGYTMSLAAFLISVEAANRSAEEEAVGAGVVRFGMFVTATVTDDQDLALAASVVDNLGTSARIRLRRAVGAQAATFAASLPLGLVTSAHLRVPQAMREAM